MVGNRKVITKFLAGLVSAFWLFGFGEIRLGTIFCEAFPVQKAVPIWTGRRVS